jgi:hypothetical protein
MFLERFVYKKLQEEYKKYSENKENYNNDSGEKVGGVMLIFFFLLYIFLFVMWVYTIIYASKCQGEKTAGIIVAVFAWPIFWIVKFAGGFCQ